MLSLVCFTQDCVKRSDSFHQRGRLKHELLSRLGAGRLGMMNCMKACIQKILGFEPGARRLGMTAFIKDSIRVMIGFKPGSSQAH